LFLPTNEKTATFRWRLENTLFYFFSTPSVAVSPLMSHSLLKSPIPAETYAARVSLAMVLALRSNATVRIWLGG